MKLFYLTPFLALALCGCRPSYQLPVPAQLPREYTHVNGITYRDVFLTVITNNGHRFAVAIKDEAVSICEVTDASSIDAK